MWVALAVAVNEKGIPTEMKYNKLLCSFRKAVTCDVFWQIDPISSSADKNVIILLSLAYLLNLFSLGSTSSIHLYAYILGNANPHTKAISKRSYRLDRLVRAFI